MSVGTFALPLTLPQAGVLVAETVVEPFRGPVELAGIRNFGWLLPGTLARGEQPPLERATFEALGRAGVGAVLSLREDGEAAKTITGREVGLYDVARERELARRAGLLFRHLACTDLQAPRPDEVAAALRAMD